MSKCKVCVTDLMNLQDVYKVLLVLCVVWGVVDFEIIEMQIVCDENGRIEKIVLCVRNEVYCLIEEVMLVANVCSADFIQQGKHPGLFRVYEGFMVEKKDILCNYLKALGLGMGLSDDPYISEFQKIVQVTKDRPDV